MHGTLALHGTEGARCGCYVLPTDVAVKLMCVWPLCLAMLCLAPLRLYALGGKATLLLSPMDSQLEALQDRVCAVNRRMIKAKQDLVAAKEAKNGEQIRSLFELLLSLDSQLLGLDEEQNVLLRTWQASSNHRFQIVPAGLPVFTSCLHSIQ